jgi:hypothetical protein
MRGTSLDGIDVETIVEDPPHDRWPTSRSSALLGAARA